MNKHDIIKEYKNFLQVNSLQFFEEYKAFLWSVHPRDVISPTDFVLGAGGACVMHGIHTETSVMEMGLHNRFYLPIKKSKKYTMHLIFNETVIAWNDNIDLYPLKTGYDTVMIDGVCCETLEGLFTKMVLLNKQTDQETIEVIRKKVTY